MSGMVLGNMSIGGGAQDANIRAFLMLSGKVVCFELESDSNGVQWWKMPLVLENAMKGDQVQTFFRPLIPFGPETRFKQISTETMICEVVDPQLKSAYMDMAQKIRAQLLGIELPGGDTSPSFA